MILAGKDMKEWAAKLKMEKKSLIVYQKKKERKVNRQIIPVLNEQINPTF